MVNTKIISQPSQPSSLLSSPLPPPPSFLSLLSLSSSHYPKISNSHSISFFPFSNPSSSTAYLSIRTRHPPHSFYSPHPNSQFLILSRRLSLYFSILSALSTWFVILSGGFRLLSLRRIPDSGGAPIGFDSRRTFGFAGVPRWRFIFLISCFNK